MMKKKKRNLKRRREVPLVKAVKKAPKKQEVKAKAKLKIQREREALQRAAERLVKARKKNK